MGLVLNTTVSSNVLAQVQNVGAGAVARTLSQMVIHPLDTIKTRMQVRIRQLVKECAGTAHEYCLGNPVCAMLGNVLQVTAQIPRLQEWQHAAAGASKSLRSGAALSLKVRRHDKEVASW
eukprot:scaffold312136_cov21-Tisochrysis_lutea.AAC.2